METKWYNDNFGASFHDNQVMTFEVSKLGVGESEIFKKDFQFSYRTRPIKLSGYNVVPHGVDNLYPLEVKENVKKNRLLPELLEKQIKILYAKGIQTYIQKDDFTREWKKQKDIFNWLESWKRKGLKDDYQTYINKVIRDFYYVEAYYSKWRFNLGNLIGKMPIAGLENISPVKCRFASNSEIEDCEMIEKTDLNYVLVANWRQPIKMQVYPIFDESNIEQSVSVSYYGNTSFDEEIYCYNTFYEGLRDWIRATNLTPKYVNSFLRNSLSAKIHVIIPHSWVQNHNELIEEVCVRNSERKQNGKAPLKYQGIEVGTRFHEGIIKRLIDRKLREITSLMSGEGKNQGKLFSTVAQTNEDGKTEQWKFEEIPTKYKEFIEGILKYDQRADETILSGKGLDASISNISKDGVISKSGSDLYYNYLIYQDNLTWAENVVLHDLNLAIKLNFPNLYQQGYRLGFYRNMPSRQEETSPQDRMNNNIQQ
jgi:hypothetical protein